MSRLVANVWAGGRWYGPAYPDAGDPPAGLVTNPSCWDGDVPAAHASAAEQSPASSKPAGDDGPPPKSGPGSGDGPWTAYARRHKVQVTDAMKRSEVIAACEAAEVPTE